MRKNRTEEEEMKEHIQYEKLFSGINKNKSEDKKMKETSGNEKVQEKRKN